MRRGLPPRSRRSRRRSLETDRRGSGPSRTRSPSSTVAESDEEPVAEERSPSRLMEPSRAAVAEEPSPRSRSLEEPVADEPVAEEPVARERVAEAAADEAVRSRRRWRAVGDESAPVEQSRRPTTRSRRRRAARHVPRRVPSPRLHLRQRRRRRAQPAAAPAADSREPWGRVDDDGTVSVREGDGWRVVGQYPDGSPEEALAYFERKYADLASEVGLLEVRHRRGGASPPTCAAPHAPCTRSSTAPPPSATSRASWRASPRSPSRWPRHPRPKPPPRAKPSTRPSQPAPSSSRRSRRSPLATRAPCSGSRRPPR